ncbi:MAG: hypothetical protein IT174_08575 [Acidobacteria bacterium]|nr:hypothetical protein [Acidobacteriota bacterium]
MRLTPKFAVVTLLMVVCVSSAYSQREIPGDLVITLWRSTCFGSCPSYSLTIATDLTVKFVPLGNPAHRGEGPAPSLPLMGSVTADDLRTLLAEIDKISFWSLGNNYGNTGKSKTGPTCPKYATDNPSAAITIERNGKKKTVSHYLGCSGTQVLDDLEKLENKIDEIAKTTEWTSQFGWGAASVVDLQLRVDKAIRQNK